MSFAKSIDFLLNQIRSATGAVTSGTATFYSAGTTTLKTIYLDKEKTQTAANPYTLSADGNAELFGEGLYRIIIKDEDGITVYDWDDVSIYDAGSLETSVTYVDASGGAANVTWTDETTEMIVCKDDSSAYTVTLTPPAGYTISGLATYVLYAEYETVHVVKSTTSLEYIIL